MNEREELEALRRMMELELKAGDVQPTTKQKLLAGGDARFVKGLKDPIDAGAQLLTQSLPEGLVNAVNTGVRAVNQAPVIGSITQALGMTPATPGEISQGIRDSELEYQDARRAVAGGEPEFDGARLGGNVLAGMAAIPAMGAQTFMGRLAAGAAGGGMAGTLQPVVENQENFWTEKGKQVGTGAAIGAAISPVAAALARVIRPNTDPQIKTLMDAGVTPTPGQITGGLARVFEDKATSIPLLGDAILSSRKRGLDELNRAAYARALNPIGQKADDLPVGREGVTGVKNRLNETYDKLLPKLSWQADQQFTQGTTNLRNLVSSLPKNVQNEYDEIFKQEVVSRMTPQGLMNGQSFKDAESALGQEIARLSRDPNRHAQKLRDAVKQLRAEMREALQRANPQFAQELGAINKGWAAYARIRDASARLGDKSGGFTPADLAAAVRKGDNTVSKDAFSGGRAFMQDLSDAATAKLPSKYPDSGTPGRLLLNAGAAGALGGNAYMFNPLASLALVGTAAPYAPGIRQMVAALLASRPQGAGRVAQVVRNNPQYPAAAVAPMVNQAGE